MIQAKELRIGNWIEKFTILGDSLGFCKVEAKDFLAMSNHPEWQSSIPLTEEILFKCGFEKSRDGEHFFIGHFGFCLVYDGQDYCMKPLITDNMVIAYCRYLHQLQNLYFALTGKELEVKL